MKIMIDTNVLLDVLFARKPFLADSIGVLHMCEDGFAEGAVTVRSLTEIYYFLRKQLRDEDKARETIRKIAGLLDVCDVTQEGMKSALAMDNRDLEDALLASCAKRTGCRLVITRNPKHFNGTGMKCRTPEEFVL